MTEEMLASGTETTKRHRSERKGEHANDIGMDVHKEHAVDSVVAKNWPSDFSADFDRGRNRRHLVAA